MSDEQNKNSEQKVPKKNIDPHSMRVPHLDTLDQGTEAFMQWLNSEDKQSINNPIILKEFVNNKHSVLYDNTLGHDVIIETQNGVPRCKNCDSDDCGHVGFTVLLEQKYDNEGSILD